MLQALGLNRSLGNSESAEEEGGIESMGRIALPALKLVHTTWKYRVNYTSAFSNHDKLVAVDSKQQRTDATHMRDMLSLNKVYTAF